METKAGRKISASNLEKLKSYASQATEHYKALSALAEAHKAMGDEFTGYLGGATATHVRVHDNFVGPVIGGVLVWLAVYLRDARVRALLPIRVPLKSAEAN